MNIIFFKRIEYIIKLYMNVTISKKENYEKMILKIFF